MSEISVDPERLAIVVGALESIVERLDEALKDAPLDPNAGIAMPIALLNLSVVHGSMSAARDLASRLAAGVSGVLEDTHATEETFTADLNELNAQVGPVGGTP